MVAPTGLSGLCAVGLGSSRTRCWCYWRGSYDQPRTPNSRNNQEMLDQLSHDIKTRLDALLSEAGKLRHALTALGSRDEYPKRSQASRSSASRTRSSRRAEGAGTPTASSSRQRSGARAKKPVQASSSRQRKPREGRSARPAGNATRSAPGATKRAVLQTLSAGEAMTAGQIAAATGLGRAKISTTLSRLAKSGELNKVARGYQIARPASPDHSLTA